MENIFPLWLMATENPQSDANPGALDHQSCGLFAIATRTEHRDEEPYTMVCNPERDFIPLDRLRTCQSTVLMVDPYGANSVRSALGDTITPRAAGVEPHTPLEEPAGW
jgi:hypothetical protein